MRAGRKRLAGPRYRSGDPIVRGIDVQAIAMAHPERRALPARLRADERAGTPLGRLVLMAYITAEQAEAARLYANTVRRFQEVYCAPNPNPRSLGDMASTGQGRSPVSFSEDEVARRTSDYSDAWAAIWQAGYAAQICVNRVAVYDQCIPLRFGLADLCTGLRVLADFYGLTNKRKSRVLVNA